METILAEFKDDALALPLEAGERLGWKTGTKLQIETRDRILYLRPQELSGEEIARRAGIYLAKYVGDATDVKPPIRLNGKWRVEATLSYRPQTIGYLIFTAQGELIEEESDSPAKLRGPKGKD